MVFRDQYRSFAELDRSEAAGRVYRILARPRPGPFLVMAPHGGGIEPGASELACAIAGEDLALYCFEGLDPRGSQRLHITSVRFDEPQCLALLSAACTVVAVHGCLGDEAAVYVGGLDAALKGRMIAALRAAGFHAENDNSHHSGSDSRNLCNRGRSGGGVQLELTEGLRRRMFAGPSRPERQQKTELFERFVRSIRDVIQPFHSVA